MCTCMWVHVYAEARGQHQASSSIVLHFIFWGLDHSFLLTQQVDWAILPASTPPTYKEAWLLQNNTPRHVSSDLRACPFCHSSLHHLLSCHGVLFIMALGTVSNTIYIFTSNEAKVDSHLDHWGVFRYILCCYHQEINWELTSELPPSLCDT